MKIIIIRDTRKTLKGGKMKNEKCKIVYTIKLFTFIFCIWKRIYLLENIVWENVVYIITNLAKFF